MPHQGKKFNFTDSKALKASWWLYTVIYNYFATVTLKFLMLCVTHSQFNSKQARYMSIFKNTSVLLIWEKIIAMTTNCTQLNVTILNTLKMVRWSHKTYVTNKLTTVYLKQLESHYVTLNLHGTKALKANLLQLLSQGHMLHTQSVLKAPLQWAEYLNSYNRK